jgi:hypothetical protein
MSPRIDDTTIEDETSYGHNGSCTMSYDSWIPGCAGTTWTDCCTQHLNIYGFVRQLAVCGNATPSKVRAERGCFAPPSCSGGKAYGAAPAGCDAEANLVCPAGATQHFQNPSNGKWLCRINSGAPSPCANKDVGPAGCANCWQENYTGVTTTGYTPDTCTFYPDTCGSLTPCAGNTTYFRYTQDVGAFCSHGSCIAGGQGCNYDGTSLIRICYSYPGPSNYCNTQTWYGPYGTWTNCF